MLVIEFILSDLFSLCPPQQKMVNGACQCNDQNAVKNTLQLCVCKENYTFATNLTCILCPNDTTWNSSTTLCYCASGTLWTSSTTCELNQTCPQNATLIAGICVCNNGIPAVNGTCGECGNNYSPENGSCVCYGVIQNDICIPCPANTTYSNHSCVCNVGYVENPSGLCQLCPNDSQLTDNSCTCADVNAVYSSLLNRCSCQLNYTLVNQQCMNTNCSYGFQFINSTCTCQGQVLQGQSDQICLPCPNNQSFINGSCRINYQIQCEFGYTIVNGKCVCYGNIYHGENSSICVQCAENQSFINNSCQCSAPLVMNASKKCVQCSTTAIYKNGQCVCRANEVMLPSQICNVCPSNSTKQGNSCSCSQYLKKYNMFTNACECTNGVKDEYCEACPDHTEEVNGTCLCMKVGLDYYQYNQTTNRCDLTKQLSMNEAVVTISVIGFVIVVLVIVIIILIIVWLRKCKQDAKAQQQFGKVREDVTQIVPAGEMVAAVKVGDTGEEYLHGDQQHVELQQVEEGQEPL